MKRLKPYIFCVFSVFLALSAHAEPRGTLVLAGGELSSASKPILDAFVNAAGGMNARIGILPAATNAINKRFKKLVDQFEKQGINTRNIELLEIAVMDDQTTKGFDESSWSKRGDSFDLVRLIDQLDAIWFLDGDQTRITEVLLKEDGSEKGVLGAIRRLYARGGVIGGTGAGAAALSRHMMVAGDSLSGLIQGSNNRYESMHQQDYGMVVTKKGLNLFPNAMIDTSFTRKARLGRLITGLLKSDEVYGIGIDADTALVIDGIQSTVVGSGNVTLVNTSQANSVSSTFPLKAQKVFVSLLKPGDGYNLVSHKYQPRQGSITTYKQEYFDIPVPEQTNLLTPNRDLDVYLGYMLLDNKGTKKIQTPILGPAGKGVRLTFSETNQTRGYWKQDFASDSYSFTNVRLDIQPMYYKFSDLPFSAIQGEDTSR